MGEGFFVSCQKYGPEIGGFNDGVPLENCCGCVILELHNAAGRAWAHRPGPLPRQRLGDLIMRNMKLRVISAALAACMVTTVLPVSAFALGGHRA